MLEAILGSSITIVMLAVISFISRKFIAQYVINFVEYKFKKDIENFKSELEEKRQEQQHFHEMLLQTISQENKELQSRKISAADHLWRALLSMKKFSVAAQCLGTWDFAEIKKRAADPKIQTFLNRFSQCTFTSLLAEAENTKNQPAELARPWVTHKAWSLYLAYSMIIYYAVTQFESAKIGGELDGVFKKGKLLEVINNALPESKIDEIHHALLSPILDSLEFALIVDLKNFVQFKEDAVAIGRAKTIFEITSDIKNTIKIKNEK